MQPFLFRKFSTAAWRPNGACNVLSTTMKYVDTALPNCPTNASPSSNTKEPIVLLHGNPTSSYLWRHIIPELSKSRRCLAPDLVGMGDSGDSKTELSTRYTLKDHANHLDAWFNQTLPADGTETKIHLVVQDWGSALGFDWSARHSERVASITFFEAVMEPFQNWEAFPTSGQSIFQKMRTPDVGEIIVLEKNTFVKKILPASMHKELSPEEASVYNKRYEHSQKARLPTLVWPRQIPFANEGCAVARDIVQNYCAFHSSSSSDTIPKLYIDVEPGFFAPNNREIVQRWKNVTVVGPVQGLHFAQEDAPHEIAQLTSNFISTV